MKLLAVLFFLVAASVAEPTGARSRFLQRQEAAPYQAAGYRPAGDQFRLPERQRLQDPPRAYSVPDEEPTTTEASTEESTDTPTTLAPESSEINEDKVKANLEGTEDVEQVEISAEQQPEQQGIYYIILPTGQLQRVQYLTTNNAESMVYSTQLRYQNVEPIRGPIYAFNPAAAQYVQLIQQ
ncbi:hypothetical protein CBL_06989 [Carabus blaptoides fortunei]